MQDTTKINGETYAVLAEDGDYLLVRHTTSGDAMVYDSKHNEWSTGLTQAEVDELVETPSAMNDVHPMAAAVDRYKTTITRDAEGIEVVRYWSAHKQQWREQRASAVPDKELAAMSSTERAEVMAAAERDKRLLDGRGPEVGRPSRGLDTLISFRVPGELAERMRERAETDGKKVGETWRAAAERYLR